MSIKGFPSQQKNLTAEAGLSNNYVTVQPTGSGHYSLDTVNKSAFRVGSQTVARTVAVGSDVTMIVDTATQAIAGDFIRFEQTATMPGLEVAILKVTGDNLYLSHKLPLAPTVGNEFYVMRHAVERIAEDGSSLATITPSAINYRRNLLLQEVFEDTGTPANSRPLPTKEFSNAGVPVDLALESTAVAIRTAVEIIDNAIAGSEMQVDVVAPLPAGTNNIGDVDIVTLPGTVQADIAAINTKTPALGQALMAASQPVVIASNQSTLPISAATLPLPTGAATETTLAAINTKLPAQGQALMAASQPVVIASNQSAIPVSGPLTDTQLRAVAVPVSFASSPLPTGAATETTLAAINTKTLAAGQALMAASSPVVIASNQSAVPISAASLPLPTGAATETTLAAINTKTPVVGQALMAASSPVVIASNQSAVPISAASLPLPTGAATETTLAAMSAKLPATLGTKTSALSLAVVLASDSNPVPTLIQIPAATGLTQAAISFGTTAVRLTTSGSAPTGNRRRLQFIIEPPTVGEPNYFMGSASVTSSGATRGLRLYPGTLYSYENSAQDFFIISDTASQTVFIMEHT